MSEKVDTFFLEEEDYPNVFLRVKNGMVEVGVNVLLFSEHSESWAIEILEECACIAHQIQAWHEGYVEEIL